MTDRHPDADHAVDEQKRRARRRLVGAVVLALAAAVILPMLLEKEPQPLGEDVSVQIPPVDEGKFVNRLTRKKPGDTAAKAESEGGATRSAAKPEPPNADAAKAAAPEAPAAKPATEGGGAAAPSAPAAETPPPAAPGKSIAAAEQRVLAAPPPKPTPARGAPRRARADPSSRRRRRNDRPRPAQRRVRRSCRARRRREGARRPETFAVQLAAFSDDKGANALANKLKKAGYATAYVETVDTEPRQALARAGRRLRRRAPRPMPPAQNSSPRVSTEWSRRRADRGDPSAMDLPIARRSRR